MISEYWWGALIGICAGIVIASLACIVLLELPSSPSWQGEWQYSDCECMAIGPRHFDVVDHNCGDLGEIQNCFATLTVSHSCIVEECFERIWVERRERGG